MPSLVELEQTVHPFIQDTQVFSEYSQFIMEAIKTFSFSFGVLASGFFVCESNDGIGTMICQLNFPDLK